MKEINKENDIKKIEKENNIFTYATNELSQDAFLCWLFSFAMENSNNEPELKECAIDFLKLFIPELKDEKKIWLSAPPLKQYKSIDILLTVNDKYKVIIEDKTFSDEHDDQLLRYKEKIEKEFPEFTVCGIFFKIGFQSNMEQIISNGYRYIGRNKILSVIEKHIKSNNLILNNYYYMLKNLDDRATEYKKLKLNEWDWIQAISFFDSLKTDFEKLKYKCGYEYVSNRAGGFYCLWIGNNPTDKYEFKDRTFELYLQLEFSEGNMKICYKAMADKGKIDEEVRDCLIGTIKGSESIAAAYGFKKPTRYGVGKTVTLGLFGQEIISNGNCDYETVKQAVEDALIAFEKMKEKLLYETNNN